MTIFVHISPGKKGFLKVLKNQTLKVILCTDIVLANLRMLIKIPVLVLLTRGFCDLYTHDRQSAQSCRSLNTWYKDASTGVLYVVNKNCLGLIIHSLVHRFYYYLQGTHMSLSHQCIFYI